MLLTTQLFSVLAKGVTTGLLSSCCLKELTHQQAFSAQMRKCTVSVQDMYDSTLLVVNQQGHQYMSHRSH